MLPCFVGSYIAGDIEKMSIVIFAIFASLHYSCIFGSVVAVLCFSLLIHGMELQH